MRLGHITVGVGGLSTTIAAIAVSGRMGVFLVAGLASFLLLLVAVLAITGTFGSKGCRHDAQAVLAILLGRRDMRSNRQIPPANRRSRQRPRP